MKGGELSNVQREDAESPRNDTSLQFCSLSTPSTSSGSIFIARSTTTPLSQGKKYIDVQLLTREHLYLAVDVKCKVSDVYRYVCAHVGLNCVPLFGLARYSENEYRFCDPSERLSKQAPAKNWQKTPGWGTDLVGNPSVILYLRVHTYVDCVRLISCPISLLHYYLQLRENVRIQWEPSWVPEERCFEAAALALQADYGDYQSDKHTVGYFRADAYFPVWVVNGRGLDYVLRHMPSMHHDLEGLDPYEAQVRFCREVSRPPCSVNMHLYRLRRNKIDAQDTIYLGITTRGLELFEQKPTGDRQHTVSFSWSKIGKLAFDRKKFTLVGLDGQKMVFYTSSDEKSRYLLNFCRAVHQNVLRLQPVIAEARRREEEERKQFRESYIYSDTADLDWIRKTDTQTSGSFYEYNLASPTNSTNLNSFSRVVATTVSNGNGTVVVCCGAGGQRVSLVSDASSNTTSGIVSDRQHTHDDSENENEADADFEIATGCDSSPLVSELSLATTGTTPPLCSNGSQHSEQASPRHDSKIETTPYQVDGRQGSINIESKSATAGNSYSSHEYDDDGDPGEGTSSVGPCSDRTVTAAADDSQSTETTSTTGKLEDFCTEGELPNVPMAVGASPGEERAHATWSSEENNCRRVSTPRNPPSVASSISNVSIAELRRLTLQDYADRQPSIQRRASPPIVPPPQPPPFSIKEMLPNGELSPQQREVYQQSDLDAMRQDQQQIDLVQNESMTMNQQGLLWNSAIRPKAYRIVASQVSNDGSVNRDQPMMLEHRSSPSPSRMDALIIEPPPPPPPPYPYELDNSLDMSTAQSYSLSNLPSSSSSSFGFNGGFTIADSLRQSQPGLQRTSLDGLPNYEQALQYKAELGRRLATSSTLDPNACFHAPVNKRWPTVSGIHPAILDQLVTAVGARRLQQAQSEPGLAAAAAYAEDFSNYEKCYKEIGPVGSYAPCSSYAAGGIDGVSGAYRSLSSHQLATGPANGRICTCHHPNGQWPALSHYHHFHPPHHPQGPTCTPNGLYVKQPRAQLRSAAVTSAGQRMHAMDCQHSSSQMLYNGFSPNHGSNKAVARVHSMYEAANVRRSLEYEYYRRFEQQVVQNTRRELRKQQQEMEKQLAASLSDPNSPPALNSSFQSDHFSPSKHVGGCDQSKMADRKHSAPGHFCESCQENHTAGKLDLAKLKDIIQAQNVDLPLMRALCNDHSWSQQLDTKDSAPSSANDSAAHPLLRQKKPFQSRAQITKSPIQLTERPMTWHESYYEIQAASSSSWPPCELSIDH